VATGYYPGPYKTKREARIEGGPNDRWGNKLRPLQHYNENISVATDPRIIPSGTILTIDEFPGKVFHACDVGKAIKRKRIDICVANRVESFKIPRKVTVRW
jgi:3D (Asp-Asp-Asp) domain-containing protein